MKVTHAVLGSLLLLPEGVSFATPARYPNELERFKFHETAEWQALVPLQSTIAEVRAILGKPRKATDLSDYFAAYPGDDRAAAPLFEYSWQPGWDVFIYFVPLEVSGRPGQLHGLRGRVQSIDLIPRQRVSFARVVFPKVFAKHHVIAADAAWDDYTDEHGLTYQVYTSRPAHSDTRAGDLNRISYGAPRIRDEAPEVE